MSDFVRDVMSYKVKLPTVTGEMGDTWISGISSDPLKLAQYRVVTDTLTECITNGIRLFLYLNLMLFYGKTHV